MSHEDIAHRFAFHAATTQEKKDDHSSVRAVLGRAALYVDQIVPAGREKALALTKLEEAMFWANAAIARDSTESGAVAKDVNVITVAEVHAIITEASQ